MPPVLHFNRISDWPPLRGREKLLARAATAALEARGERVGEVSYTFVSADEIQALNRDYLERDRPTDVIAFDLGSGDDLLGDVYISPEVAAANAVEHGQATEHEVLRLVIHGSLHVIGLDHPEDPGGETAPMFVLQEELLRALLGG
ncbi:MAG: rRNA maturation RNase YbeY [Gemmatimonadetes bacterium]|nr:rRNA maturation RNase YbeY [Gemmatimonadota bacterium]MBT8479582.1 rRNA maturation RNase YbeY [Gemmatimonadota bacterium]NNK47738.1 rRNA maturation RNase YbeY [Gemmatimonadota bacterium]